MPPFTQEMVLGLFKCCGGAGDCTCQQADWLPQCRCYSLSSAGGIRGAPGNAHRDLVRKFFKNLTMPEPFILHTKVWRKNAGGERVKQEAETPLFLPHLWIPTLEDHALVATLGTEKVSSFWATQSLENPRLKMSREYMKSVGNWKQSGPTPFALHGDAAPHTEMDGLMVLSMRSICTSLPVDSSQLLLLAIPKTIITEEMWEEVWDALVWSFEAMAQGKMPVSGPKGGSLPLWLQNQKGKQMPKGMVYAITGDLEFYYSEFGLPRPNQEHPCAWCRCNQGSRPWNDFRSTAAWRGKLLTPAELCESLGGHKIFGVSGVNPLAISLDTLHTIDLGVACHAIGNLLWEICESKAGNRDTSMAELNKEIQEIYTKLNIPSGQRVGHLKWKDLAKSNSEYPVLKHVKARNGLWDGNGLESPSKYFWNGLGSPSRLARVGKP